MTPHPADRPHFPCVSSFRRQGNWLFVSGQMAMDDRMQVMGDTVGEQTRICLDRIERILNANGLDLSDITKTTVWLQRTCDFEEFNRNYASVFNGLAHVPPARSTVRADLMLPGALVEVEAIAHCRPNLQP